MKPTTVRTVVPIVTSIFGFQLEGRVQDGPQTFSRYQFPNIPFGTFLNLPLLFQPVQARLNPRPVYPAVGPIQELCRLSIINLAVLRQIAEQSLIQFASLFPVRSFFDRFRVQP